MTLDELLPGNDAIISEVTCEEPSLRKHILDMGLTPGTEVTMVKAAPLGDPLELRLRGYELTLRKADQAGGDSPRTASAFCPGRQSKLRKNHPV